MYDYIIVGAGSAGCLLANRLSASGEKRVCLLEAGPEDKSPLIHMPIGIAVLANSKKLNWQFSTVEQKELNNRTLFWPRGKALGGSSSINAMIYIRGHKKDYQEWEKVAGKDWGWERVLPLFKRLENNQRFVNSEYHGNAGELYVSDLQTVNPLSRSFVDAGVQSGLPLNLDFNGENQEGVGLYQVTQKEGRRWSSAKAFLTQAESRSNLTILTEAQATKVLFDGKKAIGVSYQNNAESKSVHLNPGGEVILSGGAVQSPQLLMLSGIGDASELNEHGIPVIHDLPEVGKNLQDHLDVTIMNKANSRLPIAVAFSAIPKSLAAIFSYIFRRKGFLTSNVGESGGFMKTDEHLDRPNIQFHFLPAYLKDHGKSVMPGYGFTLHVCDLLPKSRGRIGLESADPLASPLIDPKYFDHPDDMKTMIAAVKLARKIFAEPALSAHTKSQVLPEYSIETDEQLEADIRQRAETIYHPVGTCRMGDDSASVVDPELKVRGVDGLRVVDASIMPTLVAGNTNAPTIMIAENAADMILSAD